jgi:hypothetical protein
VYRGPSLLKLECSRSGKTDFAIEREGSCAVDSQHDGECGEGKDVVVDSEALVDADVDESDEHVDGDQRSGEAGEQKKMPPMNSV